MDLAIRRSGVTEEQLELRELDERPRRGLGIASGGVECELHRSSRTPEVSGQLSGVRNTGVRRQARAQRCHPVECCERLPVAAELDQGVADRAVRSGRARKQPTRAEPVAEGLPELMSDERERGE